MEIDEDELNQLKRQMQNQMPGGEEQMEDDEGEDWDNIDPDNIDYEHLDPQILEMAEQMGIHPKEVLKMIIQMQKEGDGGEEGDEGMDEDDEDEEMDEEALKQQLEQVTNMNKQQVNQSQSNKQQKLPHEAMAKQEGSHYSENE